MYSIEMDFISYNQLVKDVRAFCGQLPKVDCVIGVPRSGMLVASLIALNLNIPLSVPELPKSQLAGKRIERREIQKIITSRRLHN
jgi:hypoxanthine phosphoribosyltransferase